MIIGITGTLGSGKGTVVEFLKKKGFTHYSARDVWNEELKRRGIESNRDSMLAVANDMRAKHGPDYFARTALAKAQERGGDVVIESVRSVGEADYLRAQGAKLWAVDAYIRTRYERIVKRASETDKVSFDEFKADEDAELANTDPAKPNLTALIAKADTVLYNNGTPEELFEQAEKALKQAA